MVNNVENSFIAASFPMFLANATSSETTRLNRMSQNQLTHGHFNAELIIGLVAPVGAETYLVRGTLEETLQLAGYRVEHIKISRDVIPTFVDVEVDETDRFSRYRELMNAGNQCRSRVESAEILGKGAAFAISKFRAEQNEMDSDGAGYGSSLDGSLPKTAFIIDSLKRPEEVNVLRIIYSTGFVLLGIHEESHRRKQYLKKTCGMSEEQAQELIDTDREEIDDKYGQRVNETFHLADCFVELIGDHDRLRCDIRRIVELCFGNPFLTPTFDEMAMFQAFASALRSADLSRQVGAVIARDEQILATGANDCPRAGGGLYLPRRDPASGCIGDQANGRDYMRESDGHNGCDSNRVEQLRILGKLADRLRETLASRLDDETKGIDKADLIAMLDHDEIQGLTEYGRVVHAEMDALLSCGRQGIKTTGATLYSTTFPCHNCAKHLIAAGVDRVVYVEPYSKSRAMEFHTDSIATSGQSADNRKEKVLFEPFVGVGPRRFFEFFSMKLGSSYDLQRKVKETGAKKDWDLSTALLRLQMKPVSYLHFEQLAASEFGKQLPAQDESRESRSRRT